MSTGGANAFFDNKVIGGTFSRDVTFLSTLRALVYPRMPEGDSLHLYFGATTYSKGNLEQTPTQTAMERVSYKDDNTISVHNFAHPSAEDNVAWMEFVRDRFESHNQGWHRVEKVTVFFKRSFDVLCFINPEKKSVCLYTSGMDYRKMHYLQAGIPAFFPWYFDPEVGITEQEMELVQSLREKTANHYLDCIAAFAERYDFQAEITRRLLAGFETRYEQLQCDSVRNSIESVVSQIERANNQIVEMLRKKRDYENTLMGLELKIQKGEGSSEIMEYFLCNRHLDLVTVDRSTMTFVAKDSIHYFDEAMAERVIENPGSYVYRPDGRPRNDIPPEDMKLLMTAIFLDQKFRVRFCAAYTFQLEGSVRAYGGYRYDSRYRDYMPNPHIHRFNCLGSYQTEINKRLQKRDYIGALEQAMASCCSLNFADSTVMRDFMLQLYGAAPTQTNNRCIELPTGRVVEPKEAIAYLKAEKESANG